MLGGAWRCSKVKGIYGLPKSDVLRFKNKKYRIIIRPSGTEPKMKIYLQAKGRKITEAQEKFEKMKSLIVGLLEY